MRTKSFPHGIHPPEEKSRTEALPIETCPPPELVHIPLHQHFGSPAVPLVNKGDAVALGQKIGEAAALFSASVHASVSGKVQAVEGYHHPSGKPVLTVSIANDGEDRSLPVDGGPPDPSSLSPDQIRQAVKEAGIVGLGGAAFPTAVKLSPPKDKPIDTVIINGCECEPLLTADHRMMLESTEEILQGAELVRQATGAGRIVVGIETNKRDALDAFRRGSEGKTVDVIPVKTKYPQGAEKNLIFALLKRKVPAGGLPFDVGVVVQNVGTVKAVWDAVSQRKPLYERVLTASGPGLNEPKNLLVRIGTPFRHVLDHCGGLVDDANLLVMGGPMMGLSQWTDAVPVIKGTSGILAWREKETDREFACIRCGRCVDKCPMTLVPTQLMKYVRFDHMSEAEAWRILDCVECGCCQYTCPAQIRLVHWIRLGKNKIMSARRKQRA